MPPAAAGEPRPPAPARAGRGEGRRRRRRRGRPPRPPPRTAPRRLRGGRREEPPPQSPQSRSHTTAGLASGLPQASLRLAAPPRLGARRRLSAAGGASCCPGRRPEPVAAAPCSVLSRGRRGPRAFPQPRRALPPAPRPAPRLQPGAPHTAQARPAPPSATRVRGGAGAMATPIGRRGQGRGGARRYDVTRGGALWRRAAGAVLEAGVRGRLCRAPAAPGASPAAVRSTWLQRPAALQGTGCRHTHGLPWLLRVFNFQIRSADHQKDTGGGLKACLKWGEKELFV